MNIKTLSFLLFLLPSAAMAEGKVGGAYLSDIDAKSGYRGWLNVYEPVGGRFSLGTYAQHERGPAKAGKNTYVKVGGYYDLTKKVNLSLFGESTSWRDVGGSSPGFDSERVGVGLEVKLW